MKSFISLVGFLSLSTILLAGCDNKEEQEKEYQAFITTSSLMMSDLFVSFGDAYEDYKSNPYTSNAIDEVAEDVLEEIEYYQESDIKVPRKYREVARTYDQAYKILGEAMEDLPEAVKSRDSEEISQVGDLIEEGMQKFQDGVDLFNELRAE